MSNIYFFYGLDTFRSLEKFKTWKAAFERKYGTGSVREIAKSDQPVKLTELLGEGSLFSPTQLITVKNPLASGEDDNLIDPEDFLKLLEKGLPANTHLLLWQGGNLDKRLNLTKKILGSSIQLTEFTMLAEGEALQFLASSAARLGRQIKKDAAELLARYTSVEGQLDSGRAVSSLEQLAAYMQAEKVITLDHVLAVVAPSKSEDIFLPLLQAFSARDKARFYKLIHEFGKNAESDQELLGLVSALFEQVKTKLLVYDLHAKKYGPAQIDEILEFKKGRARFVLAEALKYKRQDLEETLEKIISLEYKVKQGQTVLLPALQNMIL